jgi:hypothetical protein
VVALSEHSVGDVADRLRAVDLPHDRLILGVGSGASSSLDLVREGVVGLRGLLPAVPIAVAAVGPRMLRLAGQVADVVVANWALPDRLSIVRDRVREGALAAGRREPRLVAYVRTAIGPEAARRLRDSMDQYRAYGGGHYARAFDEQPDALVGIAIESGDAAELAEALAPYRWVVSTVVVRGLPADDSVDSWLAVARASGRWGRQASSPMTGELSFGGPFATLVGRTTAESRNLGRVHRFAGRKANLTSIRRLTGVSGGAGCPGSSAGSC